MNEIQLIYNWVIAKFESYDLVNTITIVPTIEIDANKENVYMLVNLDLTEKETQEDAIFATFVVTIVQQRNISPIVTDSKLLNDTNYLDNINETTAISSKFISNLLRQNNDYNIDIQNEPTEKILKNWSRSGLDGVQFTIILSIPNQTPAC